MADAYIEKGTTYEIDGKVYECLEFLHVKPGKGSAFVRTKLKDVINGGVVEKESIYREKDNAVFLC